MLSAGAVPHLKFRRTRHRDQVRRDILRWVGRTSSWLARSPGRGPSDSTLPLEIAAVPRSIRQRDGEGVALKAGSSKHGETQTACIGRLELVTGVPFAAWSC